MKKRAWKDDGNKEEEVAMSNKDAFVRWFRQATGNEPYPFQIRFARGTGSHACFTRGCLSPSCELVDVPTGIGKTSRAEHMIGLLAWPIGNDGFEPL